MVVVQNPQNYKLLGFEKSQTKHKKYDAILENKKTRDIKRVSFGQFRENGKPYEQYKDKIGLYKEYNHYDKERRRLYRIRHQKGKDKLYSSQYFSYYYLW